MHTSRNTNRNRLPISLLWAYTNIYFVADGIKKAKTLDKAALIKALEETKYVSPIGETLTIKPSKTDQAPGFHQAEDPPVAERAAAGHLAL